MRSPKSTQLALAVVLIVAVAFLLYTLSSGRHPTSKTRRTARRTRTAVVEQAARPLAAAAPSDADFGRYEAIVQRNIFSPPAPPPPPKPKPLPSLPVQPIPPSQPVRPPAPSAPSFPGWAYAGYIEIDGKMLGIIQNATDRTVEYLAVGDSFRGVPVTKVNSNDIEFTVSGAPPAVLHRADTWQLTPLDKGATATQARPGRQPQGGQAGQAPRPG
ncbi:MAG: hypothetical protein ABSD48_01120 [Armatimonadota bacterium]|jgi:hypothetical protein